MSGDDTRAYARAGVDLETADAMVYRESNRGPTISRLHNDTCKRAFCELFVRFVYQVMYASPLIVIADQS